MKKFLAIFSSIVLAGIIVFLVFAFIPEKTYTVSFDTDGGTLIEAVEVKKGGKVNRPADPIKSGFDFLDWYLNEEIYDFNKKVSSDMTLLAKWEKINEEDQVKVTFNYNYNEETLERIVKVNDLITAPTVEQEGYKFLGWFNKDKLWDFENDKVTENLVLDAKWEKITYTVTFKNYNGEVLDTQSVKYLESAKAPSVPKREGYTFTGWDIDFSKVTTDLTITAQFTKDDKPVNKYTVKFVDFDNKVLKEEVVNEGASATAPANPTRNGYVFNGWDKAFTNVKENLTIKATYKVDNKEYDIVYHLNGGVWGYKSKQDYTEAFLKDFYDFVNPTEDLGEFMYGTSPDKLLGSWKNYIGGYYGSNNKLLCDNNLSISNNAYFFNSNTYKDKWANLGEWVKNQNNRFAGNDYTYGALDFYRYIIDDPDKYIDVYGPTFHKYPDLNKPTVLKYKPGNKVILNRPISNKFAGWYLDSSFTGTPVKEVPLNQTGTLNLYAKWDNTETYEVYFITNCQTKLDPITVKNGDMITLRSDLKKTGYKFLGWYIGDTKITSPYKFTFSRNITITAKWASNNPTLTNLVYNGNNVKRRDGSIVKIPSNYVVRDEELRAVWVSPLVGDYAPSSNQASMKQNLTEVLDLLESYNMNAVMFHVRVMNDALYKTKLAPIDTRFGTYQTFETWDYLTWFISECHKRGIEFHAWMNPYRIKSYGINLSTTASEYAKKYSSYPENPASKAENILFTHRDDGTKGAILNPAKKEVQDYIVKVCLEFMKNYDTDAIHFDDYFYAPMEPTNDILSQADQQDYINYINLHGGFNKNSSADKRQWRRMNVDNFIKSLSYSMRSFNKTNNRAVQLGIAPTGIYKNGSGSVSSGSNTGGQEHYSSYLFCDTKKWVDNEWIDYILPQSYWGFTHRTADYADVMDWWNKVVEGKRVNLYSGLGLYMNDERYCNDSWKSQAYEISNQVLYSQSLKNVKGTCIFCFKNLKKFGSSSSYTPYNGLMRLKNEYYTTKVSAPLTYADTLAN